MKLFSFLRKEALPRTFFFLGLLATPLAIIPFVFRDALSYPKIFVFVFFVILGLISWFVLAFKDKTFYLRKSLLGKLLLLFVIFNFIFSFFSLDIAKGYFPDYAFSLNIFVLVFFFLWFLLGTHHLHKISEWKAGLGALSLSFFFYLIMLYLSYFLGVSENFISADYGIFTLLSGIVFLGLLGKKQKSRVLKSFQIFSVLLSFLTIFLFYPSVWNFAFLGAASFLFILLFLFYKKTSVSSLFIWFFVLLSSIFSLVFFDFETKMPFEVESLSAIRSVELVKNVFVSEPLHAFTGFGSGNFTFAYSLAKPAEWNTLTDWTTRYVASESSLAQMIIEQGILVFALYVFIFLFVLSLLIGLHFFVMKKSLEDMNEEKDFSLDKGSPEIYYETLVLGVAWVFLNVYFVFHSGAFLSWWLWWTLLIFLLVGLYSIFPKILKEKVYTFSVRNEYSFFVLMLLLVFVTLMFVWVFILARFAYAEYVFSSSTGEGNIEKRIELTSKAVDYYKKGEYLRTQSELFLDYVQIETLSPEPDKEKIIENLGFAVDSAKRATEEEPKNVKNWEMLATIYLNSGFLVDNEGEWIQKSLEKAVELEPTNPVYAWRLANTYYIADNLIEAEKYYKKAIELKSDYVKAYTDLARLYAKKEDFDKAVKVFEPIFPQIQGNAEALYTLGAYAYNRNAEGDRDQAMRLWTSILTFAPGHANTLFALAVYYNEIGDTENAKALFEAVLDLDPNNEEVKKRLESL